MKTYDEKISAVLDKLTKGIDSSDDSNLDHYDSDKVEPDIIDNINDSTKHQIGVLNNVNSLIDDVASVKSISSKTIGVLGHADKVFAVIDAYKAGKDSYDTGEGFQVAAEKLSSGLTGIALDTAETAINPAIKYRTYYAAAY